MTGGSLGGRGGGGFVPRAKWFAARLRALRNTYRHNATKDGKNDSLMRSKAPRRRKRREQKGKQHVVFQEGDKGKKNTYTTTYKQYDLQINTGGFARKRVTMCKKKTCCAKWSGGLLGSHRDWPRLTLTQTRMDWL